MSAIKLDGITLANTANSKAVLDSGVVFPTGHILQTVSNFENGIVTASSGTASTSASNSHSGYVLAVSVGLTFITQNPYILVYANSGEIDVCDSRMVCRIFYNSSVITSANINNAVLFETTYGQNQAKVCSEVGRGISNTAESHRPGVSYQQMVQINAAAGGTYYFALGMARQLSSGSARVGNGAPPQIVVSEIQS